MTFTHDRALFQEATREEAARERRFVMRAAQNGRIDSSDCIAQALGLAFALLLAFVLALWSGDVEAGRVHPDLEARLAALPEDSYLPVIVELATQASPAAAAAKAPRGNRRARGHAVVDTLREHAAKSQGAVRAHLAQEEAHGHAKKVKPFWVFNGFAVTAKESAIRRLAAHKDVREVRIDRKIPKPVPRPSSAPTVSSAEPAWNIEVVRAPDVWAMDANYTGVGVVIGSFDTGVDGTHPDLASKYRGNHAISWFDPYGEHATPYDNNGHGTHTVGTMVGGDLSGYSIGVAPNAKWIGAKGWNDAENATASAFHEIFEWFLAPGGDAANAPQIVNSSWGMDTTLCEAEFVTDVQAFRSAGILPVFAAGNSGPDPETILSPGAYATSFTVGATDFNDDVSFFSSVGPSPCTGGVKPDISAPGEFILSTWPGGDYAYLDGTSMATPHVSGAAAVLLSIDPTLTVEELEAALTIGSLDLYAPGPDNDTGSGRLDVAVSAAVALGMDVVRVFATTPTAREAGTVPGVVTVTRSGDTSAALTLAYTVSGTAISSVDFATLPGSLTIPAGAASATIVVTPIDDNIFEYDETVVVTLDPNPSVVLSPAAAQVTIVSDDLPPDLVVSTVTAPSAAGAGTPFTLNDTTRNQGAGFAQASTTRYYLSANNVLDATDVMLGSRAVPALGPSASNPGSVTFTIPADTAGGTYYLFSKADADDAVIEDHESNNTYAVLVTIGADLAISAMSVPADGGAGLAIGISDTTRNNGPGTAGTSTTTYYLSNDAVLDAADVALASRTVPALAAGATDSATLTVTIPADTATGTYYVYAKADSANVVSETAESNNTAFRTLRVGPDLALAAVTAPAVAGAGTTITVSDTTRNQGGGAVAASNTRFYLSANNILDALDTPLGSRAVGALAAGASSAGSTLLTIPGTTTAGAYYLFAKADGDDAIAETQEANNTFSVAITIGADLAVTAMTVPADGGAGFAMTVSDTTRNQGSGTTPPSTTTFYLSSDASLDAGDFVLGSRTVPSLASGASDTGSITVTIPAGTATGTLYVFAKADADGVVSETSEANNTQFRTVRIGPDLLVTAFTAPATAGAGVAITVTDTIRNQGGGAAPATTTRYYLSTNNVLDAGDTPLGSRPVAALAPGAADTSSVSITIPVGTASGTYYVFAKADGDDALAETRENNNSYAATLVVGADLVISAMTAPADGGAGLAITISDTTRNQGASSAPASTTTYYLSSNAILDASDWVLGSRAVAALAAGATDSGSLTVTIPAGTAAGTWYVFAKADSGDVVSETSDVNNTAMRALRIGPDLTVTSFTVPSTAGAGATIGVTDATRNAGAGSAPASNTRYYLSPNNALDASDFLVGARAVGALAAGVTDTGAGSITIPATTAAGTYYLFAKADGDDAVAETTESNNTFVAVITIGADLVVSNLTVPTIGGAGFSMTLTDTTRNQGSGTTPASTTTFYLSSDTLLDGADFVLGSRAVPALASGASDTGSVTVTIPADKATGTYFVFAKADSGGAVSEVSEANNTAFRTLKVGPDLLVSALAAPASALAGSTISITDTTANSGGGSSAASTTRFYLSLNNVIDASDTILGGRAVSSLAPGASEAGSVLLTIPASMPSGFYYLFAKADGDGVLGETGENNNTYAFVIQITH